VKSIRILQTHPPIGVHLLRAVIISARFLGLVRLTKWIVRRTSPASEERILRTIGQLWHLVATDLAWRSVTIVLHGLLEQVPEQHSGKDGPDTQACTPHFVALNFARPKFNHRI
jgi:hypothetical protein